jgi:hypothetical protein
MAFERGIKLGFCETACRGLINAVTGDMWYREGLLRLVDAWHAG